MAFLVLGEAQLANRRLQDAFHSAQRVIALQPHSRDGHDLLGRVALRQRSWNLAEANFREALRLEPNNWASMNNLGLALKGQGRQEEAIAAFENAARLNPRSDLVRTNLSSATRRYIGVGAIGLILVFNSLRVAGGLTSVNPVAAIVLHWKTLGIAGVWAGLLVWMALRGAANAMRFRGVRWSQTALAPAG